MGSLHTSNTEEYWRLIRVGDSPLGFGMSIFFKITSLCIVLFVKLELYSCIKVINAKRKADSKLCSRFWHSCIKLLSRSLEAGNVH